MPKSTHKKPLVAAICALILTVPAISHGIEVERVLEVSPMEFQAPHSGITQSNGMTLSQAVESVRRRGNVERIIDARTKSGNGREVHHIKVLTKDGRVQTVTIPGKRRN